MISGFKQRFEHVRTERAIQKQVDQVESHLASSSRVSDAPPVLVFNASTRIRTLSLNGAFSLLAAWGIRATGNPVRYLVCQAGMHQCMLGTDRSNQSQAPPCEQCMSFSSLIYPDHLSVALSLDLALSERLLPQLSSSSLEALSSWTYRGLDLGRLCLATIRWALRRHNLLDDEPTRELYRQYLLSAASLTEAIERKLEALSPRAIVLFNGITYPEAVARALALKREIPVVTHEVGFRPLSAFFSHEHATFRAVEVPDEAELDRDWASDLESYLSDRRAGHFSMAGVQFWPEMEILPVWLESKIAGFESMVSVFTNVAFDTSQVHANTVFEHMFEWLDLLSGVIQENREILFVIRAHPDEDRPGKESMETVAAWFETSGLHEQENVVFIAPAEKVSSYELIERAQLILVYNSSIGLEAAIQGRPVLCAGRARYAEAEAAFFPVNREEYLRMLNDFLAAPTVEAPERFAKNGRLFMYRELYQASLNLSDFLQPYPSLQGMVSFRDFAPELLAEHPALQAISHGILEGKQFLMPSQAIPVS